MASRRGASRGTRLALWLAAAPLALVALVLAAWAADARLSDGEAVRNVEVGGEPVAGMDRAGLEAVVDDLGARLTSGAVRVETPEGTLETTGGDLGLTIDREATIAAALKTGRDGSAVTRPLGWLGRLLSSEDVRLVVSVDPARVEAVVAEKDPTGRAAAVEPGIAVEGGEIVAVPGRDGNGLEATAVAAAVAEAARSGRVPVVARAEPSRVAPRFALADAERVAAEAAALTDTALSLAVGGVTATVPREMLQTWFRSEVGDDGIRLDTDRDKVLADVTALVPDAGEPAVDAGLRVEGTTVVVVPGADGSACCTPETTDLVLDALETSPLTPVALPLRVIEPERTTAEVEALGVVQPIATFTTSFTAGQSRVTNIHRMADLVAGALIEPGATFSLNGHVGERTVDKGFVNGGFISNGEFTEAIGGGVSQFATTLFNAAFFGGLDFGEYQAHSIYISRYPYGREATLSFPAPDLQIENTTPHGVLIWPTYDASSITVTLFSTPYATGEQTGQSEAQAAGGPCTRVTTQRTRRYVDGRSEVDQVFAVYRPAEGVDC